MSQAWIAHNLGEERCDDDVAYWVTVCRKLLQRGDTPPVAPVIEQALLRDVDVSAITGDEVAAAVTGPDTVIELDPAIELHPTWERPFWERLDPVVRRFVHPQVNLEALAGRAKGDTRRWADFVVAAPWRPVAAVVELDGSGHARQAGVDRERDRVLAAAGLRVVRRDGIEGADPESNLHEQLRTLAQGRPSAPSHVAMRLLHGPALVHRFAYAVVTAVACGALPPRGDWVVDIDDPTGLVAELGGHTLDLLAAVADVWGLAIVPDAVTVAGCHWVRDSGSGRFAPSASDARPAGVHIAFEPFSAPHAVLGDPAQPPRVVIRPLALPVQLAWTPPSCTQRRKAAPEGDDRALGVLARDLFGHPVLRDGQAPAIRQILAGGDCVVLLPTGAGKSLVYQLAGLLRPGVTVVVDPIVSLIDDQTRRLRADGIDRVEPMHRAVLDGKAPEVFARLAAGEILFALCTPERFQTEGFRRHLASAAKQHLVNLTVVDEAHCVSEWGHDFRTAYLCLGRNLRVHGADGEGGAPPVLAMTGTASPAVLRDVLRELEIEASLPGAVQRPAAFDRKNLHYALLSGGSRTGQLTEALCRRIPAALGVDGDRLLRLAGDETMAGLVFCPHVNGQWGIAKVLEETRAILGTGAVGMYGGKPASWGGSNSAWDAYRARTAQRFCDNELVALVATKAFGMGIDKPNIAWTVHVGFPGSIEAFAQEAGRAGRNSADAVCVLSVHPPHAGRARDLVDPEVDAGERRARYFAASNRQPGPLGARSQTGGTPDNDLDRQLFFLYTAFPGQATEVDAATQMWQELRAGGAAPGETVTLPRGDDDATVKSRERALYRLVLVAAIQDYTTDFGARTFTVKLADYDGALIDEAILTFADRVEPGRSGSHRAAVAAAPAALDARIEHHVGLVVDVVYRVVERGRVHALREMYRLATGPDDDGAIRSTINAYLMDGPLSAVLGEALAEPSPDLSRFVAMLDTVPPNDPYEWAAVATRQIESFGRHPALLAVRTLGEAWLPGGSAENFAAEASATFAAAESYGASVEQARALLRWMLVQLRNQNGGMRWGWADALWAAWDRTGYPDAALTELENTVLRQAAEGVAHPIEVVAVGRRRTRRLAAAVVRYTNNVADVENS